MYYKSFIFCIGFFMSKICIYFIIVCEVGDFLIRIFFVYVMLYLNKICIIVRNNLIFNLKFIIFIFFRRILILLKLYFYLKFFKFGG